MGEMKYPGWRYHHTLDAVKVTSRADEDERAPEDDGWREEPYSDEEKAGIQTVDDVKIEEPKPPLAANFTVKADFLAAQKKYEADKAAWDEANSGEKPKKTKKLARKK